MSAIAEHHGMQFVDLTELEIPTAVIELVPESVARENVVLPLSLEGNTLKIIIADPTNFDTIQKLQFILNKDIQPVLAAHEQIIEAINRHYGQTRNRVGRLDARRVHRHRDRLHRDGIARVSWPRPTTRDAPVVKLCNLIIQEAVSLRASDIHIEPFADRVRVRYRIDGVLVERDARRAGCSPRCSPASRSWGRSTSPRSAGPRTAASR